MVAADAIGHDFGGDVTKVTNNLLEFGRAAAANRPLFFSVNATKL